MRCNGPVPAGSIECYWMVHGNGPTNHKHLRPDDAVMEARRLAAQHPGATFHVLQVVDAYLMPTPGPQRLEVIGGDDLPF